MRFVPRPYRFLRLAKSLVVLGALTLSGCVTQFTGSPHFPGGATGCESACSSQGLKMSGYVYSGEFATSCVCQPRGGNAESQQAETSENSATCAAASSPAIIGVELARRARAAQQNANTP